MANSAYKDALAIRSDASDQSLSRAAVLLAGGTGVVVLDGMLALRPAGRQLLCEVLDPMPSAHRCANEYKVLIENARRTLEGSRLNSVLPRIPRQWSVVEEVGAEISVVWRGHW